MATIGIIGTLDTKGREFAYLRERIEAAGAGTLVIDAGVLGEPLFPPDVAAAEVAAAGGSNHADLLAQRDRGESVTVMARGAAAVAARLFEEGKIHALISLGGSAGTTIGTSAMRALPVGVPKLMVSTVASGDTRPYVDTKDIAMMYSVVDIAGINSLSRCILANAAGAIAGMVRAELPDAGEERPLIGATMFGVTTPCVTRAREALEAAGYEVLVFHATGTGGRAMEDLARGGFLKGVLDITTTELADELVGGVLSAGPDRLEAAGEHGLPQVVVPGALDMVNFGPRESVPERFRERRFYQHNPTITLMRTTRAENDALGRTIARKLNAAKGPVTILLPLQGFSAIDRDGQPFDDSDADAAFINALRAELAPHVRLVQLDLHINDPAFADACADALIEMLNHQDTKDTKSAG
jgi:uncharacterized protein (UPF0261 family)